MMRVAVIGKGNVGRALAPNIATAGHNVAFGVRDPHNPKYASQDGIPLNTIGEAVSLPTPSSSRSTGPQLIAHSSNAVVCYWHVADIGLCAHFCL